MRIDRKLLGLIAIIVPFGILISLVLLGIEKMMTHMQEKGIPPHRPRDK